MSAKPLKKIAADLIESLRRPMDLEEFQRLYLCEWEWPKKSPPRYSSKTSPDDRHRMDYHLDDYGLLDRPFPPVSRQDHSYLGDCKVVDERRRLVSDWPGWYLPKCYPSRQEIEKFKNIDAYYQNVVQKMAYAYGLPEYKKDANKVWEMSLGSYFYPCMEQLRSDPWSIAYTNVFGMHATALPNIQIERFNVKLYFAYCEEGYVTYYMMHDGPEFIRRGLHYQNQVVLDRVLTLGRLLKE